MEIFLAFNCGAYYVIDLFSFLKVVGHSCTPERCQKIIVLKMGEEKGFFE